MGGFLYSNKYGRQGQYFRVNLLQIYKMFMPAHLARAGMKAVRQT